MKSIAIATSTLTIITFSLIFIFNAYAQDGGPGGQYGADTGSWGMDAEIHQERKEKYEKAVEENDQKSLKELYETEVREAIINDRPTGAPDGPRPESNYEMK